MVSLSIGHYGAMRYIYNDLKALEGYRSPPSDVISPTADTRYQIYTPWAVRVAAPGSDLLPEDRLKNQFALPIMRKDINKNHKFDMNWETKIYDPLDQRTKSVPSKPRAISSIPCPAASMEPLQWQTESLYLSRNPPSKYGIQMALTTPPFSSTPSTRSEEWSSLRQMLPSRGPLVMKRSAENWGTGTDSVPQYASTQDEVAKMAQQPQYFPRINSAMSRYAHDTWFHDRLFKMF